MKGQTPASGPTSVFVEEAADERQEGQGDEVSQAGRDGRRNVVRVDPELSGADHYADHQHPCRGRGQAAGEWVAGLARSSPHPRSRPLLGSLPALGPRGLDSALGLAGLTLWSGPSTLMTP